MTIEKMITEIRKEILETGGYSHRKYDSGFMVSLKGYERKVETWEGNAKIEFNIYSYIVDNSIHLFGAWLEDGWIYLDQSINVKNKETAIQLAKENEQLAIYDITNDKVIEIN